MGQECAKAVEIAKARCPSIPSSLHRPLARSTFQRRAKRTQSTALKGSRWFAAPTGKV
jgi:hypothetical protein